MSIIHVVSTYGTGYDRPEVAFTDGDEAFRYSTMGDLTVHEVELNPENWNHDTQPER